MKKLVAYFSASGVTAGVAEKIAKAVGADLFEIVPAQKYTDADLDWRNPQSRSTLEMKDANSRPEIVEKVENISDYGLVIIGFPVWWYTAPTIINNFIEQNDLRGKDVYVFVTSGGSGVDGSLANLRRAYPNINFKSGKRFFGNETEQQIRSWLE